MKIKTADDIGALVRQRRLDLTLSQEQLAREAGVTRQWLIRFEKGNPQATLVNVIAVLNRLELDTRIDPAGTGDRSETVFQVPARPGTGVRRSDSPSAMRLDNPETVAEFQRKIRAQEESFHLFADE